jgi:transposase
MLKRKKYSFNFKLDCVESILKKNYSVTWVAKEKSINRTNLRLWLGFYKKYGKEGLKRRENRSYTPSFKREVLLAMDKEQLSLYTACVRFNISSESVIISWRKSYELNGQAGLIAKSKGRSKKMKQPIKRKARKTTKPLTREEELLIENEYLKAENELLKKLQALVQTNKKQKP